MSVEEAAQEVRRILRQNDVEETLHYLSTVTRSIEANQHDLRAAIGNSYRDLIAACDGVVGMEEQCLDILAIESALEEGQREQAAVKGDGAIAPVLPAAWFAKRQRRRRHVSGATEGERTAAALPAVVLPLPSAGGAPRVPPSKAAKTEEKGLKAVDGGLAAVMEDRMRLDEELQSLHLLYMTVAAASRSAEGMAADAALLFSVLEEGVEQENATAAAPAATALHRAFPLLAMAHRLQRVQASLAAYSTTSTATSAQGRLKMPAWALTFHRRATTLETRLVKLLAVQLRRAADAHARCIEQQSRFVRESARVSSAAAAAAAETPPRGVKDVASSGHTQGEKKNEAESAARGLALEAEEKRSVVYLFAVVVQCHGVLSALQHSPTLLGALVAVAPGIDVPRAAAATAATTASTFADGVFRVAALSAREVVTKILDTANPTAAASSPSRWLLALVAVVLLREAQVSAVRWRTVAPVSAGNSSTVPVATHTSGFVNAAFLTSLGLLSSAPGVAVASATPSALVGAAGEVSNTDWALRSLSGLASLVQRYADYVDLAAVCDTRGHRGSVDPIFAEEGNIFAVLQEAWAAISELSGGRDDMHLEAVASSFSGEKRSSRGGDVRSIDDLLQWRLRRRNGGGVLAVDAPGTPAGRHATTPRGSAAPSASSSMPFNTPHGSPAATMRSAEDTPGRAGEGGAAAAAATAVSTTVRCRGYVEALRASLDSVPELQSLSLVRTASQFVAATTNAAGGDAPLLKRANVESTDTPAALAVSLTYVAQSLLAPLASALVVCLARDPVTLAAVGDAAAQHDTAAALSALLRTAASARVGSGSGGKTGLRDAAAVGETWRRVDVEQWWEEQRTAALQEALQRCFTVALHSVNFVERCVVQGLLAASKTSVDAQQQQQQAEGTGPSLTTVQQTWTALAAVLQQHSLRCGELGITAAAGVPSTTASGVAAPAGCQLGASARTGIDWDRFRTPAVARATAAAAPPAAARTYRETRGGRGAEQHERSASPRSGEGLFREEGLEWAKAALQEAQLPLVLISHSSGDSAVALSVEQQQALAGLLRGFRERLFGFQDGASASSVSPTSDTPAPTFNGHVVELLSQCLRTLVAAVRAFSVSSAQQHAVSSGSTRAASTSLFTRVVGWLSEAVENAAAAVRYLQASASANTLPTTAEVIHSYEVAMVLRVYGDTLNGLATVEGGVADREAVRQLCSRAAALRDAAGALWQRVLTAAYTHALRQHYTTLVQLPGGDSSSSSGGGGSNLSAQRETRRSVGLADSASWVRAATAPAAAATHAAAGAGSAAPRSVAHPAIPTPALTVVVQRTLRLLHQVFYGVRAVFSDGSATGESAGEDEMGNGPASTNITAGGSGAAAAAQGAAQSALHPPASSPVMEPLILAEERRAVLWHLATATANLFEEELLPQLNTFAASGASSSDGDDMRLQWLMDLLFVSSVWCSTEATDVSGVTALLGGAANAGAAAALGNRLLGPDAVAMLIPAGPVQRAALQLEKTCDAVRWRSAVPLVLNAFRHFLCASAALWVVAVAPAPRVGEAAEPLTLATAVSMRAAGAGAPSTAATHTLASAPPPMERLLQPKERVDRLALLPIALSSAAAAAGGARGSGIYSGGAGGALGVPAAALPLAAPTAAALSPYSPPTSAGSGGSGAGGASAAYRAGAGVGGLPSHAGASAFFDGAVPLAGDNSRTAAAGGVGGTGSTAAAAASSLWGTTQRGWNQLWGTS